jgi:hypothetical protein
LYSIRWTVLNDKTARAWKEIDIHHFKLYRLSRCPFLVKRNSSWMTGEYAVPCRCRHGHIKMKITPVVCSYIWI